MYTDPYPLIPAPASEDDQDGAQRVFEEFYVLYKNTLVSVETYLEQVLGDVNPAYAGAYRPWYRATRTLLRGVYLTVRRIPLPDPEAFVESLRTFSFEGAAQFLNDVCISCKVKVEQGWSRRFRENVDTLIKAHRIIVQRQKERLLSR